MPHSFDPQRSRRTLMRRFVFPLLTGTLVVAGSLAASDTTDPQQVALATPVPSALSPLDVHPRTSLTIVEQLRHNHYLHKALDDAASSEVFDKYLELLDAGRAYFLASDVQAFEKYRYSLDDAL